MKCAISNIAWAPGERRAIYGLMQQHHIGGLEIAPGLAFPDEPDPFRPSSHAEREFRAELAEFGLALVSMQSLLFGVNGAQLFGNAEELAALEAGIGRAIALAGALGIPNLVFGSPRNRAYSAAIDRSDAHQRAGEVFARLGDRALAMETTLAIEPTPAHYGTNFLNTLAEATEFVAALGHPAICLNYDIGALLDEGAAARAGECYAAAAGRISHVHISEPGLAPAPADPAQCARIVGALLAEGYAGWLSIEMRAPERNPLAEIEACFARLGAARAQVEGPSHA